MASRESSRSIFSFSYFSIVTWNNAPLEISEGGNTSVKLNSSANRKVLRDENRFTSSLNSELVRISSYKV